MIGQGDLTYENLEDFELRLVAKLKEVYRDNLLAIIIEGSYGSMDFIPGKSDYDCLVLTRDDCSHLDESASNITSKIDLQVRSLKLDSLIESLGGNPNRYFGILQQIKLRSQCRVLEDQTGIISEIPDIDELVLKNQNLIAQELRDEYLHATGNEHNIFKRSPAKWMNYIINMTNQLLLSRGIVVRKKEIPRAIELAFPNFTATESIRFALRFRFRLDLKQFSEDEMRKQTNAFLEAYRREVFKN